jgi:hypothetical protein
VKGLVQVISVLLTNSDKIVVNQNFFFKKSKKNNSGRVLRFAGSFGKLSLFGDFRAGLDLMYVDQNVKIQVFFVFVFG